MKATDTVIKVKQNNNKKNKQELSDQKIYDEVFILTTSVGQFLLQLKLSSLIVFLSTGYQRARGKLDPWLQADCVRWKTS